MTAQIIDGKQVAADMREELKNEVAKLKEKGIIPGLGVILVGEDPASQSYVTAKERACENIGLYSDDNRLPADASQEELMALVEKMNKDPKINGILVQLPLPKGLNEAEVLLAIDPAKDVDGFHPVNVGKMVVGEKAFLPCTPHGVIQLLKRSGVTIEGAEVVIVGRSNIVGKPLANMLIQKKPNANATVTVLDASLPELYLNATNPASLPAGYPITILVQVNTATGLTGNPTIFYKETDGTEGSMSMTNVWGGSPGWSEWTVTLPVQLIPGTLEYYISATNAAGTNTTRRWPFTSGSRLMTSATALISLMISFAIR